MSPTLKKQLDRGDVAYQQQRNIVDKYWKREMSKLEDANRNRIVKSVLKFFKRKADKDAANQAEAKKSPEAPGEAEPTVQVSFNFPRQILD